MAIILLACRPCVVIVNWWDRFCTLGRAPCTKESLPNFHEWCRVTRYPRIFRRLTGCQRDTPVLGVTLCLSMLPNEFFVLKTHLNPMAFIPSGKSTRSQTRLDAIEFISSFMALYHELDALELMAYENVSGSFSAPML